MVGIKKKKIPLIGIIGISLTIVIGSGIWKDSLLWPNEVGILSIITITIGWLLFFCTGLAYAECVSMFPRSGGPYSYVSGAFGKKVGSIVGILYLFSASIIGSLLVFLTALFTLSAINASLLIPRNLTPLTLGYLTLFILFSAFSKMRSFWIISLTWALIKILLLTMVLIFALSHWQFSPVSADVSFVNYQSAISSTVLSFMGFDSVLVFSSDVDDVEIKMPKGILITLPIILILYLFVGIVSSGLISPGEIPAGTSSVELVILLAEKVGFPPSLIFAFATFSAAGTCYGIFVTIFRQLQVLAEDDVLPDVFKKKNSRANFWSILFLLCICFFVGGIIAGTSKIWPHSIDIFDAAASGLVFISTLFPAGLIALYLRIKLPALKRPFKTPLFFIVFPLAIILSLYLFVLKFWNITIVWPALIILIVICLLVITYVFFFQRKEKGLAKAP